MTKKHFIKLAEYIIDAPQYCEAFTPSQIMYLADFCLGTNANFDRERWLNYIAGKCGPNGGAR